MRDSRFYGDSLPVEAIEREMREYLGARGIRFERLPEGEAPERVVTEPLPVGLQALNRSQFAEAVRRVCSRFVERVAASGLRRIQPIRIEPTQNGEQLVCAGSWPLDEGDA